MAAINATIVYKTELVEGSEFGASNMNQVKQSVCVSTVEAGRDIKV